MLQRLPTVAKGTSLGLVTHHAIALGDVGSHHTHPTRCQGADIHHNRLLALRTEKLQKTLVGITDEKLLAALDRKDGLITCDTKLFDQLKQTARDIGLLR